MDILEVAQIAYSSRIRHIPSHLTLKNIHIHVNINHVKICVKNAQNG